jgi:hypothetical protein
MTPFMALTIGFLGEVACFFLAVRVGCHDWVLTLIVFWVLAMFVGWMTIGTAPPDTFSEKG